MSARHGVNVGEPTFAPYGHSARRRIHLTDSHKPMKQAYLGFWKHPGTETIISAGCYAAGPAKAALLLAEKIFHDERNDHPPMPKEDIYAELELELP